MHWYKFKLLNNNNVSDEQEIIIDRIQSLSGILNPKEAKDTLLLYRMSLDFKNIIYYLCSPIPEILKIFVELYSAVPCPSPNLYKCNEGYEVKYLTGDLSLWKSINEQENKNKLS